MKSQITYVYIQLLKLICALAYLNFILILYFYSLTLSLPSMTIITLVSFLFGSLLLSSFSAFPSSPSNSGPHCVATFSFASEAPSELSISKGDKIELVGRLDQDWLKGRLGGHEGIFPASFVDIIEDLPTGWEAEEKTTKSKSPSPTHGKWKLCVKIWRLEGNVKFTM